MLKLEKPTRNRRGFTLIETLIAITVLFVAMMAMLSVIPFGFNAVQTNSIHVQAVAVGQQSLDDQRNAILHAAPMPVATTVPIDPGQSYLANGVSNKNYGNFAVAPNGCATVQMTGSPSSQVNVYSCSVTVSWTESGASKSVTEQSYVIAPKP